MKKIQVPKIFYNRFLWQLILAVFMLGMAFFFIRHEHLELLEIKNRFSELNMFYVLIGSLMTLLYILTQAEMYVWSFKSIGQKVSLPSCTHLFLRRNLVSVFLPAGGFASLAFFSKSIESQNVSKSQIHLASTIYGIVGILSVVLVAVPALGYAMLQGHLQSAEIFGFMFLVFLSFILLFTFYSVLNRGIVYRFIERKFPKYSVLMNEFASYSVDKKSFAITLTVSFFIEIIGVGHLYVSMLALGLAPSLAAAFIGYVVMVILLIASPFLRGLGAIEVSTTFILSQYGFPLIAAASVTLLFRLFEFWIPLFLGIGSFVSKKDNLFLRVLPAVLLFILGITNIISAISPAIPARLHYVENLLPGSVITASVGFIALAGLLLILLAVFLLQGSKRAWYAALILSSLSVVGHLTKAVDFEESILSALVVFVLLYTGRYYKLKPHPLFTGLSLKAVLYGFIAVLLYGILGFYFMDKSHFGVDFVLSESVKAVLKLFFLLDDSGLNPLTPFAKNFIYSIYISGGIFVIFVLTGLLKPYFEKPYNSKEDIDLALQLVTQNGQSALDFFKIYPDKLIFITEDRDAFVSFRITKHLAVVLENPVAPDSATMIKAIKEFDAYCAENGFVAIYYRVPEASLPVYRSLNKKSFPVGQEAVLDLNNFTMDGGKMKPTRSAVNRLTGEGFEFKVYNAPVKEGLLQKAALVSDQWLKDLGKKEIIFTQGIFNPDILKNHTICTIENAEEKVFAFLDLVPVYVEKLATYDLIRKADNAPNGVLDMLLSKTFLYLKELGYEKVNMGLAPMSGMIGPDFKEKTVKYAFENLKPFAHFKGLRKYKEKFFPQWEKKYLVYDHNYHLLQVPAALKKVSATE